MGTKRAGHARLAGLVAVAAIAVHGPARAQEAAPRAGWQPYLGCWQSTGAEEDEGILCLVPDGMDVEMLTIVDGAVEFREPLLADGATHDFEREDCRGTESAYFSDDRRRLYTASLASCDGEATRRSTGIISMPTPDEWIDVRAIETNGAFTVWSQRYRRASHGVLSRLGLDAPVTRPNPFALRGGVASGAGAITLDDVVDASRNVDGDAVRGWLVEVGQPFEGLRADDLVRLEEAGVATAVIDVVVAVSFPEHFALNDESARVGGSDPYLSQWYPYYGYGYYGRGYYGRGFYGGWYPGYYNPVVVSVGRGPRDGGGQAVAGRGYRAPGRATSDAGTTGGSVSSGGRGGDGASTSRGSRGGTGRKAVRRGGK